MTAAVIDTLALARKLRDKAHFTPEQAEGVAEAINEMLAEQVATKADLREEMAPVKAELLLVKWMVGFNLAITAAILTLLLRH